jgi:hypothetical protein
MAGKKQAGSFLILPELFYRDERAIIARGLNLRGLCI